MDGVKLSIKKKQINAEKMLAIASSCIRANVSDSAVGR
jgi:hypothetical protein